MRCSGLRHQVNSGSDVSQNALSGFQGRQSEATTERRAKGSISDNATLGPKKKQRGGGCLDVLAVGSRGPALAGGG